MIMELSRSFYTNMKRNHRQQIKWQQAQALFEALKCRDADTAMHSLVTGYVSVQLLIHLRFQCAFLQHMRIDDVYLGGLLHDIGKLSMGDDILKSDKKLDQSQRDELEGHVAEGVGILRKLGMEKDIVDLCLYHHERADGSGYPAGRMEVPAIGRLAAVADVYAAMKVPRAYQDMERSDADIIGYFYSNYEQYDLTIIDALAEVVKQLAQNGDKSGNIGEVHDEKGARR
ncbi:HD domain-containing protein [Paenibacillus sp. MER TA 81-3]|uniref:HD-GYP domain-containing protein n=1 Tax=Paenibacillus sp. MER TA 81-3 TaxID=2939573 RepID=UPI00204052B6|nr:HD domain-containing phosphohydrolase [Paenibacillus sp. MER TA 81-3]MCM3340799.1 HD domain-containing protein [Paenibacillus sp. MER TA 81-3]